MKRLAKFPTTGYAVVGHLRLNAMDILILLFPHFPGVGPAIARCSAWPP
jgi:hypothetical protein